MGTKISILTKISIHMVATQMYTSGVVELYT